MLLSSSTERPQSCTDDHIGWAFPSERKLKLVSKGVPVTELLGLPLTPAPSFIPDPERLKSYAQKMAEYGVQHSSMFKSITCDKR